MDADFPNIFFTADVAELLKIPEWRVIKFSQSAEYQITPSHSDATGSGSRRVYDLEDVSKMALAVQLLDSGLGSKTIGEIMLQIKRKNGQRLSDKLKLTETELHYLCLAIFRPQKRGKYLYMTRPREVLFVSTIGDAVVEHTERAGDDLLLVTIGEAFEKLARRLKVFQKRKEKKHGSV